MWSISRMIMVVSVAVSLLLVAGTYYLMSGFGDRMLRQSTTQHMESLAKVTFSSMYQVMNQGWKREQVESFADNVARSVVGAPMRIEFHRSEVVAKQYGASRAVQTDEQLEQVMKTGRDKQIDSEEGIRFLLPMTAKSECLACHATAKKGDVLGVIDLHAGYEKLIGDTRLHLFVVLLLLAPLPLVAGFIMAVRLDGRSNSFVTQVDEAIDRAQPGQAPDFASVQSHFAEFRELLSHFKRLVKG